MTAAGAKRATDETVAVVVPVYRNAATLQELVIRLEAALTQPWTLRLVVDACPEGSEVEARRLADQDDRVRVTALAQNVGQHRALATGLAVEPAATAWVCMDGDLQDPPEAVPRLLRALHFRRAGAVFAGRRGGYEPWPRRVTGTLHRWSLAVLTPLPVDAGAFLAMDRRVHEAVVDGVLRRNAPSVVVAAGTSGAPLLSLPVRRDLRRTGSTSWTGAARARQSLSTLGWAARHHRPRIEAS